MLRPAVDAQSIDLTAITLFGANDQGAVNIALRWNTLYLDAAWDVALTEGEPPAELPVAWLNSDIDCSLAVPLAVGEERTFSFFVASIPDFTYYGMNLYFGGAQEPTPGTPGISVVSYTNDGVTAQPFQAIAPEITTMGWPIADVGGAGTLVHTSDDANLKVTLTDYVVHAPSALLLDFVQQQEPGGLKLTAEQDGLPDLVGFFTLRVEEYQLDPPADLICSRSQDGRTVDLSWTSRGPYDSIKVLRDGAEIATLGGNATSFQDTNVAPFVHSYQVLATLGGESAGPLCRVPDPANPQLRLTALTLFGASMQGAVNPALRWNTTYLDAAWDIAVFEGDAPPEVPVSWINNPGNLGLDIPLQVGEARTFGFTVSTIPGPGYYGLNLFFEGAQDPSPGQPGISVVAYTDEGVERPEFRAIPTSVNTMGWPIADVGGAGTLVYRNAAQGTKVTMTDFVVYSPDFLLQDLVQQQEPGGRVLTDATDGSYDLVGQMTLTVERYALPISDLVCSRSPDGKTVQLSWQLNGAYDAIKVARDGVEIATLSGDATSFEDSNVPALLHVYSVTSVVGNDAETSSCRLVDPANPELTLTAMTLFGTNASGGQRIAERWNTNYLDAAWDIGLHEGPLVTDAGAVTPDFWLNSTETMAIDVRFVAGQKRTFSFYVPRSGTGANHFGMNLFFDGAHLPSPGVPAISVFAPSDEDGPDAGDPPAFQPNSAAATMGWPIANVRGAGTVVYEDATLGLRATLTDFVSYDQAAINGGAGVDVVQRQEPGGRLVIAQTDGEADFVGEFTLEVETLAPPPVVFHRGDADDNGEVQLTDAIRILGFLFLGLAPPSCNDAADADDNGELQLTDAVRILGYLFLGTVEPALPGPQTRPCGSDPTPEDALGCDVYASCAGG